MSKTCVIRCCRFVSEERLYKDRSMSSKETNAGPKLYRIVQYNQLWTSIRSKGEMLACLQMLV
jgi:hypothetical protein